MGEKINNFHGNIACFLETKARNYFKYTDQPVETIFCAREIEYGTFVEAMIILLRSKSNYSCDFDINNFIKECSPYLGKKANEIDYDIANNLYKEFTRLFNSI